MRRVLFAVTAALLILPVRGWASRLPAPGNPSAWEPPILSKEEAAALKQAARAARADAGFKYDPPIRFGFTGGQVALPGEEGGPGSFPGAVGGNPEGVFITIGGEGYQLVGPNGDPYGTAIFTDFFGNIIPRDPAEIQQFIDAEWEHTIPDNALPEGPLPSPSGGSGTPPATPPVTPPATGTGGGGVPPTQPGSNIANIPFQEAPDEGIDPGDLGIDGMLGPIGWLVAFFHYLTLQHFQTAPDPQYLYSHGLAAGYHARHHRPVGVMSRL